MIIKTARLNYEDNYNLMHLTHRNIYSNQVTSDAYGNTSSLLPSTSWGARGGVVVKTLRYKPAGRGFLFPDRVIGIFQ